MKRFSFILLFMSLIIVELAAQSEYIIRGQNAFIGSLSFITNSEALGYGVQLGYSFKGFFDAGLLWTKTNAGQAKDGILSPSITFYPLKQEDIENAPTLGLSCSYQQYGTTYINTMIVPNPDTTILNWISYQRKETYTVHAFSFDVIAQRRLGYWKIFFFQPMLGAGFTFTDPGMQFELFGGISIGTRVVNGPLLLLVPSIEHRSNLTTFRLQFKTIY